MRLGKPEWVFLLFTSLLFFSLGAHLKKTEKPLYSDHVEEVTNVSDTSFYPFFRSELEKLWNQVVKDGFSGTILVVHQNNVLFEQYHTRKYRYIKDTVSPNSRFEIASISKQFTAVAILQLYERGLLDLNDTVQKFIPDFPYKGITIHSLLCHRSGLPNYIYFLAATQKDSQHPISNDSLLAIWEIRQPAAYFPPNRRFKYSNTGYVLLASIVEKVSKLPFEEYLRKNIFEPLGMFNTDILIAGRNDSIPRRITGYSQYWRNAREDYLNGCYGDKGITSTAKDLVKWDQALYDSVILSPKTLELAFKPHGNPKNLKHNYGYGWRIYYGDDYPVYYHTGWWQGFKTLLVRFSNHKITVVVLKHTINGRIPKVDDFYRILRKSFLPSVYNPEDVLDTLPADSEDDENHIES